MLDPRGGPTTGPPNWSSGYMPAEFQGTVLSTSGEPILNLMPPEGTNREQQRREIDFINGLNASHETAHPGYSELAARIASYELAFNLQVTAPKHRSRARRPAHTRVVRHPCAQTRLAFVGARSSCVRHTVPYRTAPGRRGVRFVQIYSGGGPAGGQNSWDGHHGIEENLRIHAPEVDQPIAALLADLDRAACWMKR